MEDGQSQYLRAIKLSEKEKHFVAVKLLRRHRHWTEEDRKIFEAIAFESEFKVGSPIRGPDE